MLEKLNSLLFLHLKDAKIEEFGEWVDGIYISRVPWELRDRIVKWVST